MRAGLVACGVWLAACAPQAQSPVNADPILIEGGVVEGRVVRAAGLQLALPSPTRWVARNGSTLLAAYPFQLLVYHNGFIQDSLPLPGVPTFVRAKPRPLVGLEDRLFLPGLGTLAYKAKDALSTSEGVYWLNNEGLYLERRLLAEGRFDFLAASERYVYAFAHEALRLPDYLRVPLPASVRAAVVLDDLFVLTPEGIYRLSLEGLHLASEPVRTRASRPTEHTCTPSSPAAWSRWVLTWGWPAPCKTAQAPPLVRCSPMPRRCREYPGGRSAFELVSGGAVDYPHAVVAARQTGAPRRPAKPPGQGGNPQHGWGGFFAGGCSHLRALGRR